MVALVLGRRASLLRRAFPRSSSPASNFNPEIKMLKFLHGSLKCSHRYNRIIAQAPRPFRLRLPGRGRSSTILISFRNITGRWGRIVSFSRRPFPIYPHLLTRCGTHLSGNQSRPGYRLRGCPSGSLHRLRRVSARAGLVPALLLVLQGRLRVHHPHLCGLVRVRWNPDRIRSHHLIRRSCLPDRHEQTLMTHLSQLAAPPASRA